MPNPTKTAPKSVTPRQPWIEAFVAGHHIDAAGIPHDYSDADIDTIAARVNAQVGGGFVPPMVAGHPQTDSPRQGGIFEARTAGVSPRRLYLRTDEVVPEFAEKVQKGEFKYVSVALYPDLGLRHLGVLGGANPAVKGLAALEFGEGVFAEADAGKKPEDIVIFQEPWEQMSEIGSALMRISWRIQSIGGLFSNLRDQLIASGGSVDDADKVYPSYLIESLTGFDLSDVANDLSDDNIPAFSEPGASHAPKPGDTPSSAPTPPAPQPPSGGAGGSAENSELERLRTELATRKEGDSLRAFSERLDAIAREGRLLPAQRPGLEKLFKRLCKENEGAMYAEGETAYTELDELLSSLPKVVEFSDTYRTPPAPKNPLIADAERRSGKA